MELLPEDESFNGHFTLKELTFRKSRKVLVHMTLITQQPINRIKYITEVRDFVFEKNIWMKTDRYKTKLESSPGYITMIHPKLLNREQYALEITEILMLLIEKKNTKYKDTIESERRKRDQMSQGYEQRYIPNFHLETSTKKWGQIQTEALRINCAKDDAERLKQMLSLASEQRILNKRHFHSSRAIFKWEGKR